MSNLGADRREMPSPVTCSGAERRDKVLDEVSTAFHGGAAAVKERAIRFPLKGQIFKSVPTPKKTNKPSLTPIGTDPNRRIQAMPMTILLPMAAKALSMLIIFVW